MLFSLSVEDLAFVSKNSTVHLPPATPAKLVAFLSQFLLPRGIVSAFSTNPQSIKNGVFAICCIDINPS
jgi:hypothetical protein